MSTIEGLEAAEAVVIKAGKTGARCHKPTSNGDFKYRGKVCSSDADCCGAATGKVGGAVMTIEVCQPKGNT